MEFLFTAPTVSSLFGEFSTGNVVSGCLIAAFIVLAVGFSFFRVRKMRRQLHLLADETRVRKAQEEELANIGSKPAAARQRRDPWA
jgi:hypothetical protein